MASTPKESSAFPRRSRTEASLSRKLDKHNRQKDLLAAMGTTAVTERQILDKVGDNRYTREILRKLIAMCVVERTGKGGSHDPFRYRVVKPDNLGDLSLLVDPVMEVRMKRIESKILRVLAENSSEIAISERCIRLTVGDNTGTGKALRRLVRNSQVDRTGKGGAGNPFMYRISGANFSLERQKSDASIECASCLETQPSSPFDDMTEAVSASNFSCLDTTNDCRSSVSSESARSLQEAFELEAAAASPFTASSPLPLDDVVSRQGNGEDSVMADGSGALGSGGGEHDSTSDYHKTNRPGGTVIAFVWRCGAGIAAADDDAGAAGGGEGVVMVTGGCAIKPPAPVDVYVAADAAVAAVLADSFLA